MKNKTVDKGFILTLTLGIFLAVSILTLGLFHEWTSCVATVLLGGWLFAKAICDKEFSFNINLTFISIVLFVLMYGITAFWAIDKGMAFVGFLKFLPVLLFCACVYLQSETEEFVKRYLPVFMGAVVMVCAALMQIPALKSYFSVAGRFAGCFQYPNTFALVVLVAELLAFSMPGNKYMKAAVIAVLLFGLLYTGSRTVLVLAVLSNICMILYRVKFSKKTAIISSAVFLAVIGISLALAFSGVSPFNRILTIDLGASTFVGRLLYFKDALPVILKHPFGLGYLGYFYSQTTFQTGIYSVKFIHNDILQTAIDIGWVPALLLVAAICNSIFSKGVKWENRIILSVMFLHCLFDFDLQYASVFMLLIVFMKRSGGKTVSAEKGGFLSGTAVLSLISLYFAVALALFSFGNYNAADSMYPYNTDNKINMLISMNRRGNYEAVADNILAQNEYVYIAYAEKARAAYMKGDFTNLIKYKNLEFEYAPLKYDDYEEYMYMLINGITLYEDAGDKESVEICKKQLVFTKQKYENNIQRVSGLGLKIKDKPETEFPEDIETYIQKIVNGEEK